MNPLWDSIPQFKSGDLPQDIFLFGDQTSETVVLARGPGKNGPGDFVVLVRSPMFTIGELTTFRYTDFWPRSN